MCPLSTLPDLCLFAILDRVPVHDLYHTVPLVCKRWTTLHDTACHRRKTLFLVQSKNALSCAVDYECRLDLLKVDRTPYNSKHISPFYQNVALVCPFNLAEQSQLIRLNQLFPKVQTLKIIQHNIKVHELPKVIQTLESWSLGQRITKLQLCIEFGSQRELLEEKLLLKVYLSEIVEQINSWSSLKSLFLFINFPVGFTEKISFDLKILSYLESFYFKLNFLNYDHNEKDEPLRNIQTYNSKTLRKIVICNPMTLESLVKLCPEVAQKFAHVLIKEINRENLENFKFFCTKFTSLTVLTVCIGSDVNRQRAFRQVISSLAKLKHLIILGLKMDRNNVGGEEEGENEIARLPSLAALTLYIETKGHHDLTKLDLPAIMPNVKEVTLRHDSSRCNECGYGTFDPWQLESFVKQNNPVIEQIKQCMKRARRPLIGFEKLRKLAVYKIEMMYTNFNAKDDADYLMELTRDELISEL